MEIAIEKSGLDNDCRIVIESARNGFIVKGSSRRTSEDLEYVYSSWEEMKKELDGLYSVLKQDPKQVTEEDLDKEEDKLSKEKEY